MLSPRDLINDCLELTVFLEDDCYSSRFGYTVEVTTPQFLLTLMGENKFLAPDYPMILVSKLTNDIIESAIQAFVDEKENAYWLKLYDVTPRLDMDEIDQILINKKQQILEREAKLELEDKSHESQT